MIDVPRVMTEIAHGDSITGTTWRLTAHEGGVLLGVIDLDGVSSLFLFMPPTGARHSSRALARAADEAAGQRTASHHKHLLSS